MYSPTISMLGYTLLLLRPSIFEQPCVTRVTNINKERTRRHFNFTASIPVFNQALWLRVMYGNPWHIDKEKGCHRIDWIRKSLLSVVVLKLLNKQSLDCRQRPIAPGREPTVWSRGTNNVASRHSTPLVGAQEIYSNLSSNFSALFGARFWRGIKIFFTQSLCGGATFPFTIFLVKIARNPCQSACAPDSRYSWAFNRSSSMDLTRSKMSFFFLWSVDIFFLISSFCGRAISPDGLMLTCSDDLNRPMNSFQIRCSLKKYYFIFGNISVFGNE